jgi:hypothetical protein
VLCLSAQALLIGALLHRRLLRSYPLFFAYLVIDLGYSIAMIQIPYSSLAYARAFRIFQSAGAVLQLGMAAELFHRLCWHFRQFRGMSRFRFSMGAALLTLSGFFFLLVFPGVPGPYPHLLVVWIERWESSVIAVTLILSWWLLTRFLGLRPPMRSNALAHGAIMTAFFVINAITYALALIVPLRALRAVNAGMLAGTLGCFLAWLIKLRKDGEILLPELPVSKEDLEYSRAWRRRILQYVQQAGR